MRTGTETSNHTKPDASAARHMDGIYRYQRYIYNATRKYYLLGRDRLLRDLQPPAGGTVLEVGCGTGRNLIVAAKRYPDAHFFGFDISDMMLETARADIARKGLSERITLVQGDASNFSSQTLFDIPGFDRVFISYTLSMVPPWRAAIPQAFAAVNPGGSLHIVDFGQQSDLPGWFKTGLVAWLEKFSVTPRAELPDELQQLSANQGATVAFERPFRDYAHFAVVKKPPLG